ncbi:Cro/CI family transcriptional regulator [Buttiauxella noackiae]|uniref:Cro/CI family transcriptional regulator n=1 Tax=Buttiauxella noackiae TaxID=82992 RepID=UPI0023567357|nr:Cro/CI family transcriptional regulator [Buttiauxella noackiae]MCA1920970.1 Cro/CI family transcriptional regulator [Buttiauxella noackiae]
MLKIDAINFFGNKIKVAVAAGVDRSAVSQWKDLVPEARARRLEEASNGVLHYDKDIYDQHRKAKRLEKQTSTPGI